MLFLVAILTAVFDRGVHSQNAPPRLPADQANVAATKDATWTPGSVSLEGVPANDRTTYTFKTNVNPPAAGGPSNIAPGSASSASSTGSSTGPQALASQVVIIDDGGGGGGGGSTACIQPFEVGKLAAHANEQQPPEKRKPTVITASDHLLAVIHGHQAAGWRNPIATQTFLLKNGVGEKLTVETAQTFLNDAANRQQLPPIRGDVIRETLNGTPGFIYWTGARYAWHPAVN